MSDLRFRHVDTRVDAPVESWPAEALQAALERGSLVDWRRLAAAIRSDPWGEVARTVEQIASWGEHGPVDRLMGAVVDRARADLDRRAREQYAARVRDARASTGLSLRAFARLAGTSASRLSAYESGATAPSTTVLGRIEHVARRHAVS